MFCIPVHRCPSSPLPPSPLKGGGIRRQIVNRFRSTERTGRSVGIMIMTLPQKRTAETLRAQRTLQTNHDGCMAQHAGA